MGLNPVLNLYIKSNSIFNLKLIFYEFKLEFFMINFISSKFSDFLFIQQGYFLKDDVKINIL